MPGMTVHENYVRALGLEVRRQAEAARSEARANPNDSFLQGQAQALYTVVSLMQQQALAFGLPLRDLALDGLDADRDLL
jgi:hypothetical protein